jgi:hypothetical protein
MAKCIVHACALISLNHICAGGFQESEHHFNQLHHTSAKLFLEGILHFSILLYTCTRPRANYLQEINPPSHFRTPSTLRTGTSISLLEANSLTKIIKQLAVIPLRVSFLNELGRMLQNQDINPGILNWVASVVRP